MTAPTPQSGFDAAQIDTLRLSVIRIERKLRKSMGTGGITPSQHSALFALDRHGPFRLGELADREQIGKSTVTRLVAALEAKGLAVRTADPHDARGSIITITPAGHALLTGLAEGSNDYLRQRLDALDAADRDRLLDALPVLARLAERP
ncbi:MarR family transcriptional regulator [Raineyella sp. LH-20]|uniref:MarR family winged helix-turn-helix transcriptional regulator n=1 Tax=Raineyella sp. LH-20 TaxID=3081204 RepID=UPI00295547CE|nr:MarR family transcriptional regulator [Raineyella sp. LH-20]WOP18514.1 MarR family transcriptional regulator [Raineyella sp. LH-20]